MPDYSLFIIIFIIFIIIIIIRHDNCMKVLY